MRSGRTDNGREQQIHFSGTNSFLLQEFYKRRAKKKRNNNMAMCIVDAEYAHHDVYIV